jgi:Tfp pilus assembly protein PilO
MRNLFSIIVIVAAIASFVLVVQPQYQEIQDLQRKSDDLEQVLANARRLQSIRDDLLDKRNNMSNSDLARLEKMVPENVDNVKLILELQNIANQYNLEIQTARTDREGEDEEGQNAQPTFVDVDSRDYGIIALDFNITGTYFDFLAFLRDIERNLRITDVRSLSFAGGETGTYSFQLTLETYWLKDNI